VAAACGGDKGTTPPALATKADSAEQVMWGVRHMMNESGVKQAQLNADTAFVFDRHNRFELRGNVRMVLFDSVGLPSATITSREATYDMRRKSMQARGDVVVTTPTGDRLDTSHLVFDQQTNRIRSDSAFTFQQPTQRVTGPRGFTTDPKLQFQTCDSCTYVGTGRVGGPGE
jgi:LPS export ABC transporter protein LptC